MKIYSRDYKVDSNDFEKMFEFLIDENLERGNDFIWHIARLVDWKYNLLNIRKQDLSNYEKYTRLWFNGNKLIGFVLSEDIDNSFQVFIKREFNYLFKEMTSWFLDRFSKTYSDINIVLNESRKEELKVLEAMGFTKDDEFEITYAIETKKYKDFEFCSDHLDFQSMKENKNYEGLSKLRDNVWPKELDKDKEAQLREYLRSSPIYRDEFNFVLVEKSGMVISGCEAFIDSKNCTSELERVCTLSDHWNKGYSRLTLMTTLNRLYNEGIKTGYITAWNDKTVHLYGSLGHYEETKRYNYKFRIG